MNKKTKNISCMLISLSLVLSASILILMVVKYELSYDKFNKKSNRIYSFVMVIKTPAETITSAVAPYAPTSAVELHDPGIEQTTQIVSSQGMLSTPNTTYVSSEGRFADSDLFKVYTFEFVEGTPQKGLDRLASIVLTENAAIGFFGKQKALGQTLFFDKVDTPLKVTDVVKRSLAILKSKQTFLSPCQPSLS